MSWQLPASSLRGGGFYANLQSGKRKPATTFSHFLCSPIHSPQTHARAYKYTHTYILALTCCCCCCWYRYLFAKSNFMALLLSTRHRRRCCATVDIDISGAYDSDSNKPGPRSDWPPILNLHAASLSLHLRYTPPFYPFLLTVFDFDSAQPTQTHLCLCVCVRARHAQPLCQPAALHGL